MNTFILCRLLGLYERLITKRALYSENNVDEEMELYFLYNTQIKRIEKIIVNLFNNK